MADANSSIFNICSLDANPDFDFAKLCADNDHDEKIFSVQGDSPYDINNFNCNYMSPLDYTTDVSNNNLVLLSINLQSINAKFSELNELITLLSLKKSEPDIICVQELWQFPSDADFSLSGYHKLVYKLRRNHVQGGGVGIYIKSNLNFNVNVKSSIFVDRVFESILVDISIKSKIITVGSIYRPSVNHPTLNSNQQFEQFLDLFNNLLSDLSNSKNDIYLLGDYNIDLLKINTCSKAKQYVDTFFSYGFLQTITKPTRCTNSAATLIDHCITNVLSPVHISNIITCKLSDHFPFIYTSFVLNQSDRTLLFRLGITRVKIF